MTGRLTTQVFTTGGVYDWTPGLRLKGLPLGVGGVMTARFTTCSVFTTGVFVYVWSPGLRPGAGFAWEGSCLSGLALVTAGPCD